MTTDTVDLSPDDIRALRQRLGLSRRQFADRLGVAYRTVVGWELPSQGKRPGRQCRLLIARLANAHLDVSLPVA